MNKILALAVFLLLTGVSGLSALKAQETGISFTIVNSTGAAIADGSVEVTINLGAPPFTAFLFDKAPWKGGTEIRRLENVTSGSAGFDKLLPGTYYIIVEDSDKNPYAGVAEVGIISNN